MIKPPHRSVTRFFVPMIDVLTLLFCMFLLLPIFRENEILSQQEESAAKNQGDQDRELQRRQKELQDLYLEQQRAKAILADLESKKQDALQRNLYFQVIDVDPKTGKLYYYDPQALNLPPREINSKDMAQALILRHKKEAGERLLYYRFAWTYDPTVNMDYARPNREQRDTYRLWFQGVDFGGVLEPATKLKGGGP
jgi:hypothetical protein